MPWIIAKLIGFGIPAPFAKAAFYTAMALGLLTAILVAKSRYDHNLVENHDAKVQVKILDQTLKVNEQAATQRRVDDAALNNESSSLNKVISNAPVSVSPVSTVRQRYYECLRVWQQAKHSSDGAAPPC